MEKRKWSFMKKPSLKCTHADAKCHSYSDKATQCDDNDSYLRLMLIKKLPKFSNPFDENINSFIIHFSQCADALQINPSDRCNLLLASIHGHAAAKLLNVPSLEATTWENVVSFLQNTFPEKPQAPQTLENLRQLKQQNDQSLEDYGRQIQQAVTHFFTDERGYNDTHREIEAIRHFVRGIRKPIKKHIKGHKYHSFQHALEQAVKVQAHAEKAATQAGT